jgi:hypothetical protein
MDTRPTKDIFSISWGIIPHEPRFVLQLGTKASLNTRYSEIIENDLNTEEFGVEYEVYHSPDGKKEGQKLFGRYTRAGIPQFIKYDENDEFVKI